MLEVGYYGDESSEDYSATPEVDYSVSESAVKSCTAPGIGHSDSESSEVLECFMLQEVNLESETEIPDSGLIVHLVVTMYE